MQHMKDILQVMNKINYYIFDVANHFLHNYFLIITVTLFLLFISV